MGQPEIVARRTGRRDLCIGCMSITDQAAPAQQASQRRPSQHFTRSAEKPPPRLDRCPLLLQSGGNGKIHHVRIALAVGTQGMLLHRFALIYFVTVSSRFNISLATIVHAANSGAGIDGSLFFSP